MVGVPTAYARDLMVIRCQAARGSDGSRGGAAGRVIGSAVTDIPTGTRHRARATRTGDTMLARATAP